MKAAFVFGAIFGFIGGITIGLFIEERERQRNRVRRAQALSHDPTWPER